MRLGSLVLPAALCAAIAPALSRADSCPASQIVLSGQAVTSTAMSADTTYDGGMYKLSAGYDFARDTMHASSQDDDNCVYGLQIADILVQERYAIIGPVAGTPVDFLVRMPMSLTLQVWPGVPQGVANLDAVIYADGVTADSIGRYGYCCHGARSDSLTVSLTRPAGQPFVIGRRLRTATCNTATLAVNAGMRFALPAGTALVSCHGDTVGPVLAVDPTRPPRLPLIRAWPNPARSRIELAFELPRSGTATIDLLDVTGRRIGRERLTDAAAGEHRLTLDARSWGAQGVAIIRLEQGGRTVAVRVATLR